MRHGVRGEKKRLTKVHCVLRRRQWGDAAAQRVCPRKLDF